MKPRNKQLTVSGRQWAIKIAPKLPAVNRRLQTLAGGGLLLVCLYLLHQSQSTAIRQPATQPDTAKVIATHIDEGPENENYFGRELGKLFPLLKSLNMM